MSLGAIIPCSALLGQVKWLHLRLWMYFFFYTKEQVPKRKLAATFICYVPAVL